MKEKILKNVMVILLIMTLTMANFVLLGVNAVSYAAELIKIDKATSHKNVEFIAFWKDGENEVSTIQKAMNTEDLKLHMRVSVKQEGYFNGKIEIDDSNFKLKTDILSEGITKIEGNTISLSQINAGETKELEVGIELLKDENFDLSLLGKESKVSINGIYKDSTQKDIAVKGTRTLKMEIVSPYKNMEEGAQVGLEVITNKIVSLQGQNKRMVQVKVQTGVKDNLFPIKTSKIDIVAPQIDGKYPEEVNVVAMDKMVTNGQALTDENLSYNKETGNTEVLLENKVQDNKVNWLKTGMDTFVITYIFDTEKEMEQQNLQADVEYKLYDEENTVLKASYRKEITVEEMDSIIATTIENQEDSIYKGKLYEGIERDIIENIKVQVYSEKVAEEIKITEDLSKMNLSNIYAKQTIFDKENLKEILGENGTVLISQIVNGDSKQITIVNQETVADENGKIVVTYPDGVQEVEFTISAPKKAGEISITNIKQIKENSRKVLKQATEMEYSIKTTYKSQDVENVMQTQNSKIELKETQTIATLEVNKTELSTMSTNSHVEIRAVLQSREESEDLYKNPVVRITLPEKIEKIQVNSIHMLYEDELKVKKATLEGNTIVIQLEGEQTKYKEEAIEGTAIIIDADLTVNKKAGNSNEKIKLTYSNDKAIQYPEGKQIGEVEKDISIISYAGLVTTNAISEYGLEIVNNNGEKSAKLELGADGKQATVSSQIMNNHENEVSNVKILGTFPTKDAVKDTNNIGVSVGGINVEGIENAKVYYTENSDATDDLTNTENKWTENITDAKTVKKYLVVIEKLGVQEEAKVTYPIEIPEKLEYNQIAKEGYSVTYTNVATSVKQQENVEELTLSTGSGPVIEASLKSFVGGKEVNTAKEGEIVKFAITVTNIGSETVEQAKLVGYVPENMVYVKQIPISSDMTDEDIASGEYQEYPDKTQEEFVVENIEPGKSITKYYEVMIKNGITDGKIITNKAVVSYGEVSKESNVIQITLNKSDLRLILTSVDTEDGLQAGYVYRFKASIKNQSSKDMKNVKVKVETSNLTIQELFYVNEKEESIIKKDTDEIEIDNISAGKTVDVGIYAKVEQFTESEVRPVNLTATATYGTQSSSSNEKELIANTALLDMTCTSAKSGEYVKVGDILTYEIKVTNKGTEEIKEYIVEDAISKYVTLDSVFENNKQLSNTEYETVNNIQDGGIYIRIKGSLEPSETKTYTVKVIVNNIPGNTQAIEINNIAKSYVYSVENNKIELKHILEPEEETENPENPENPDEPNNIEQAKTKLISGIAWLDENENGQKDDKETLLSGIQVKLLDTKTNQIAKNSEGKEIVATTNENGFYSLTKVPQGEYIVIFEYDTSKYILTTYSKEGVAEQNVSKAVNKTITLNGQEKTVGGTEIITINDKNIANINIGLKVAKTFDLKLDKYISKVIVQNSKGTSTQTYNDETFAKAEIDAKLVNNTNVIVEYKIKVTNEGDVDGYARKIVDYLVADYKFSSELNKDWYLSNGNLYNTSLANQRIAPGETKEITLTLTKQMTDTNTGLVNNSAEIAESYNEQGLADKDSVAGNNVKGEDDRGSADLILSIKTGQIVTTVTLILGIIAILGSATYVIAKKVLRKKII